LDKQLGIKNYKELAKQYYSKVGQVEGFAIITLDCMHLAIIKMEKL